MLTALVLTTALSYSPAAFDDADKRLLSTLVLISAYDVMWTRHQLTMGRIAEANPLLGRNPGAVRLWASFLATQLAVITIAKLLPDPYRKVFEMVAVGIEFDNAMSNPLAMMSAGYSIKSSFAIQF